MVKKDNYSYKTRRNDVMITRMVIVFALLLIAIFSLIKAREWVSVRSWLGPISDYGHFFTIAKILSAVVFVLTVVSGLYFVRMKRSGTDEALKVLPSSMLFAISASLLVVFLLISNFVYTGFGVAIVFVIMVSLLYFIAVCFPGAYLMITVFNALGAFAIYALELVSPIDNKAMHYGLRILAVLITIAFIATVGKARSAGGEIRGVRIINRDANLFPIMIAALLFVAFVIMGMMGIGSWVIYDIIIALETIIFALFYAIKTLK